MRRCLVLTAFLLLIPVSAHADPPQSSGAVNVWAAANAAVFVQRVNEYAWASALAADERAAAEHAAKEPAGQGVARATKSGGGGSYSGSPAGAVNGYPCGGDLPPCYVLSRESGGNPTAKNRTSTASGLWQFLDTTWAGFGGYARAMDAPASVQNEKARILWAGGRGCSHWAAC